MMCRHAIFLLCWQNKRRRVNVKLSGPSFTSRQMDWLCFSEIMGAFISSGSPITRGPRPVCRNIARQGRSALIFQLTLVPRTRNGPRQVSEWKEMASVFRTIVPIVYLILSLHGWKESPFSKWIIAASVFEDSKKRHNSFRFSMHHPKKSNL